MPATAPEPVRREPLLEDREFREFRDFLYDRSGLYFSDAKRFLLENRLQKRFSSRKIGSVAEYLTLVRSPRGQGELLELLDTVTTHETSFFRNRPQMEAFRKRVLPDVLARRAGPRTLRIWSAACSSGEEPYTLAMLVLEAMGAELSRWRVRILGTDIARSVLDKGRRAEYGRYSFRGTSAYYVQKYFDPLDRETFRLKEEVRRMVDFQLLNFADESRMKGMRGFHVIFCRNALIYFDRDAKRRFVAHFARALEDGGHFFVGHSESLHGISDQFKLIHYPGALAYQKPVGGSQKEQ